MKKMMIFFAWMLAACPMAVLGQTHYLESLTLENSKVEKVGRSVRVSADIRLDAVELNRQQTLRLVPVLVSADGSQQMELKPVVLEGKVRNKVTERKIALGKASEWKAADSRLYYRGTFQPVDGERALGAARLCHGLCRVLRRR